jgi:hypothetical protein
MSDLYTGELHERLLRCGVLFHSGLSNSEVEDTEHRFDFRFPADLRSFLQHAMPVSRGFPNWRDGSKADLEDVLDWPIEGILFDVEHNNFWLSSWGARPLEREQAISLAGAHLRTAPRLIPIYSHRYIPSEPLSAGNPVFSVYQADILRYRSSLASCLAAEFGVAAPEPLASFPRRIRFWDELMSFNKELLQNSLQTA